MDDDDSFFGFDTSLPTLSRGPRQELGDVELEEYDTFNDETFGAEALADDWEEQHERLAECLDVPVKVGKSEFDDNMDVAASVSQLILEDDDLDSSFTRSSKQYTKSTPIAARLFGKSTPPPYLLEADLIGSPSTQSIWSAFATNRKLEEQTSSPIKTVVPERANGIPVQPAMLPPELKTFKTVEDLERELLKPKAATPMTVADLERSIRASGAKIRSVEEIEAEVTRSKPNAPLIQGPVPPIPPHLMGVGPPTGVLPGVPPGMMPPLGIPGGPQLPPHLLRMPGPPMGMPFMGEGMQRMAMPPLPPSFLPLHRPPGPMPHANGTPRQNVHPRDTPTNEEDYDDYAGLMSTREKQWLLSIQMHQLVSDNPYVDDYYYTVQRLRKSGALKSGPAGQKLILPERAKTDSKPYSPTQFANSLGKLQVVTFTAPRKIIDVDKAPSTEAHPEGPQTNVRDARKFKKILLDVENMLYWVMQLEDAGKRFEDSGSETFPENSDARQKLESSLNSTERIFQIMSVRKGKVLVMRALRLLGLRFAERVVGTVLANWQLLFRRDAQDHILFGLLGPLSEFIEKIDSLGSLVRFTAPQLLDKTGTFNEILSYQMGLAIVSMLLNKSEELFGKSTEAATREQWARLVSGIAASLFQLPETFKPYSETPLFTTKAFEQTGISPENVKRLQNILERLSEGRSDK